MSRADWIDILIGGILIFGLLKGFKRGLINELTGAVALALGIIAFFSYPGSLDRTMRDLTHLAVPTAHIVAAITYAVLVYFVVTLVGGFLARLAKLPILNVANAVGGAFVGLVKAGVIVWAIVFTLLFFPLTPQLRSDMHDSRFVAVAQEPNASLDGWLKGSLPWFVRPYSQSLFGHHRV